MTNPLRLAASGALLLLAGCVYAPPVGTPAYVAPSADTTVAGTTCYAGAYVCPMAVASAIGSVCSCPGLGAPSFGTVR